MNARVPPSLLEKWQPIVDLVAEIVQVPAALIMHAEPPEIAVLVASASKGNPYEPDERARLDTGLYCETVMCTRRALLVPDATQDPLWRNNPDIARGMVSYLGVPVCWPGGRVFGTLCVLDAKANPYGDLQQRLMLQFREAIETDLRLLCDSDAQRAEETRKRLEESERERLSTAAALDDVRRAERELEASQERLREAVRLRDEFLSVASHELRTPLTSLQLMVQGLTEGVVPFSAENARRALRVAERQIARLSRLVEELLDVSRIQAGRLTLDLERVDLAAVVRDVLRRFEPDLAQARCPVSVEAALPVVGTWDRSKLEQVVTNLLTNAMKFGAGQAIDLSVAEAPAGFGRLVVTDHGIGISPESLPRIFERFERAVSARAYGGLGLGLYIVRSLVEAMGGTVRAESTPARGATFTVELPCAEPPLLGPAPRAAGELSP